MFRFRSVVISQSHPLRMCATTNLILCMVSIQSTLYWWQLLCTVGNFAPSWWHITVWRHNFIIITQNMYALGVVAEWSKVLIAVHWPLMVWSTLALGTYQLRLVSWVFHVIFSYVHFISLYTMDGMRAFSKPLPYNMYLLNLQIANHILIKNYLSTLLDISIFLILIVFFSIKHD